nr:probable carboxylesterase 2 [Tanacetum cinerariifolium]
MAASICMQGETNNIGDSAGANIAHNMAIRAGLEPINGINLEGVILLHPYFGGNDPIGSECGKLKQLKVCTDEFWMFANPLCSGLDDPLFNPEKNANLLDFGCSKILLCVAENDSFRDRGLHYKELMEKSGWAGKLEILESKNENHVFFLFNISCNNACSLRKNISSFINGTPNKSYGSCRRSNTDEVLGKQWDKVNVAVLGKLKYFLGIEVIDTNNGIFLNQRKYVFDLLSEYSMLACKPVKTPLQSKHSIINEAIVDDPLLDNITDCVFREMPNFFKNLRYTDDEFVIDDPVTLISRLDVSNPLHLYPIDSAALIVISNTDKVLGKQWDKVNVAVLGLKPLSLRLEISYCLMTSALIENGFYQSKSDYSLYTKSDKGVFIALLVYVDDIIITDNSISETENSKFFLNLNS